MKRAAMSLVVLSMLCAPTALRAEDDFTATSVAEALKGFGNTFRQSGCFTGRDFRQFQIAVAQMESTKFTDDQADTISEWVEEALADDPFLVVAAQRRHWELEEIGKALQEAKSPTAKDSLDGIITIEAGAANTIRVTAFAYANGRRSVCASKSIRAGRIVETPDVPEKFFERAAKKLPDKTIEQLVVMRTDVTGVGTGVPARVLGQQLQEQLADGIKQVFQTRARQSAGNSVQPIVLTYADGMDVSRAWQARLRASRSPQGGIEVRVDFRGPADSQSGSLFDRGYLAPDIVPADSDPAVIAFAETACRNVRQAIDTQTDPDALQIVGREGLCPRLGKELAEREKFHRDRICSEDRDHWREAMGRPVEAMETVAGTLRCKQIADDAQKDIQQRKDREASVADMKSAAVDLGALTDGAAVERKVTVGGAIAASVWKIQMAEADTLEAQFDGLNASMAVDLLDSSWKAVPIRPGQSGPRLKEFSTAGRVKGDYYIRVSPADGKQISFTLRVAKGWIDTAGDTVETARDLGSLGPGAQTIRKRVGGFDKGDVYKFTAQERMRLQLAAADMTSDVQLDLLNQGGQVIESRRGHDRQNVEWTVEPRSTYYVSLKPAGDITPYSLGIALSKFAPFSRPDIAAEAAIGPVPSALKHSLTANDTEYFARFPLTNAAAVSIDLTWVDRQTELELDLWKEESDSRQLQNRLVASNTVIHRISGQQLDPGTYLIRVKRNAGSSPETPFTLTVRGATLNPVGPTPPKPGNTTPPKPNSTMPPKPGKEMAVAALTGTEPIAYTLPANENDYLHSFSLAERSKVAAVLTWNDRAVDLDMELKDESGKVVVASHGTIPREAFDPVLEPGTYTVRVYRALPTSRAAVPISLTLNRTASPPARSSSSQGTAPGR